MSFITHPVVGFIGQFTYLKITEQVEVVIETVKVNFTSKFY